MTKRAISVLLVLMLMFVPGVSIGATVSAISGSGTESSPYLLYTESDLRSITTYGTNKHYMLMNDITLTSNWTPIPNFTGVLDGNYFSIKNVNIQKDAGDTGFFVKTTGATIRQLILDGGTVTGSVKNGDSTGGLVGIAEQTQISNCTVNLSVTGHGTAPNPFFSVSGVGGYAGRARYGKFIQNTFKGSISATFAGGIVGIAQGPEIKQCINLGDIRGNTKSGGIVGAVHSSTTQIWNCYNRGNITGYRSAGIMGGTIDTTFSLQKCYSTGIITGTSPTAGSGNGIVDCEAGPYVYSVISCVAINEKLVNGLWRVGASEYYSSPILHTVKNNLALNTMEKYVNGELITKFTQASNTKQDGESKTMAQLKTQATYEAIGWDFNSVWTMGDDFPILQFETVINRPVIGVSVSPTAQTLEVGKTFQLTATVAPANASNKTVTWTSTNTAIAKVSDSGLVTAVAPGQATITATSHNGKTASCVVTVTQPSTGVTLSRTSHTMDTGEAFQLTATVAPANASNKTVTWTSSNSSIVTVNANGLITAVAPGKATIQAATHNGKTASCTVTVTQPVTEMNVSPQNHALTVGESIQLTATVTPANATDPAVTWSSSNESIATVDQNGLLTAVAPGEVSITATAHNGLSTTATITVNGQLITTKINDTDPSITYSGQWTYYQDASFYNGDEHFSNQAGAYAEFTFTGTAIRLIAATSNNLGICDIYLDGELVQQGLDLYSPTLEAQKVLFDRDGLVNGSHTLRIVVTGQKNAAATDSYVTVDAFEVDSFETEFVGTTKINDTDPSIAYFGQWIYYQDASFYNGDEHCSNQAGAYAEFTFTGTAIRLIAATSDNLGVCDIYLDGELVQQGLDLYSPTLEAQKVLFSRDNLPSGSHTIKVVATGEKNALATDSYVTVDAFEFDS